METLAPALAACPHRRTRAAARQHARHRQDDVAALTPPAAGMASLVAGERPKGRRHCRALVLASSASLNLAGGRRRPGEWQRGVDAEMGWPSREVSRLALGGSAR
jgi:hypothetical protein